MKRLTLLNLFFMVFFGAMSILHAASAQPKRGGTITLGVSKELALMNPLVNTSSTEARIRDLMYEPLLAKDLKGAIQPRLAESWEISKDRKVYTFKLRRGVKFHNGAELTADDVKFAIDYTINPKNGAYGLEDLSAVERAEVVDKYTLRIHLKQHNPALTFLAHRDSLILGDSQGVSRRRNQKAGDFSSRHRSFQVCRMAAGPAHRFRSARGLLGPEGLCRPRRHERDRRQHRAFHRPAGRRCRYHRAHAVRVGAADCRRKNQRHRLCQSGPCRRAQS